MFVFRVKDTVKDVASCDEYASWFDANKESMTAGRARRKKEREEVCIECRFNIVVYPLY